MTPAVVDAVEVPGRSIQHVQCRTPLRYTEQIAVFEKETTDLVLPNPTGNDHKMDKFRQVCLSIPEAELRKKEKLTRCLVSFQK
eukprot:Skav219308  [mRNA]  locus=scaffold1152:27751:28002:- [translate_table: standard]